MTSTANVDSPWENAIPLDLIRELVSGIPARQKLLFVDTCQSGEKLEIDESLVSAGLIILFTHHIILMLQMHW